MSEIPGWEEAAPASNIIGECCKCGREINNAVEPYIIDSKGNIYCLNCYKGE